MPKNQTKMAKAVALLSGGLDSTLAVKLILEQGVEVEALNFLTLFCTCTTKGKTCLAGQSAAVSLGIPVKVFEASKEYLKIVKNPKYGYGRNMNPCLDCRIFMFSKAARYMKETGADFIVTGEVLGERPMSQRRDAMRIIERESGLDGLILRPLSAKLFEPTLPEKKGLVEREKLLAIQGRSRKSQIGLAEEFKIKDYPCPAGGCLLTDTGFAGRIKDLMKHKPDFSIDDLRLLKAGRHFRLTPKAKLIVGRDQKENDKLLKLVKNNDLCFYPAKVKGPLAVGRGLFDREAIFISSSIVARYSKGSRKERLKISYRKISDEESALIAAYALDLNTLAKIRI